jgi:hypothetical protein
MTGRRIQRKTWCTGPYAGVDYNLTLCPLYSRLHLPWATLCQSRLHPPVRAFDLLRPHDFYVTPLGIISPSEGDRYSMRGGTW